MYLFHLTVVYVIKSPVFFSLKYQWCFSVGCSTFQLLFIRLFVWYILPIPIRVRNVTIDVPFLSILFRLHKDILIGERRIEFTKNRFLVSIMIQNEFIQSVLLFSISLSLILNILQSYFSYFVSFNQLFRVKYLITYFFVSVLDWECRLGSRVWQCTSKYIDSLISCSSC